MKWCAWSRALWVGVSGAGGRFDTTTCTQRLDSASRGPQEMLAPQLDGQRHAMLRFTPLGFTKFELAAPAPSPPHNLPPRSFSFAVKTDCQLSAPLQ